MSVSSVNNNPAAFTQANPGQASAGASGTTTTTSTTASSSTSQTSTSSAPASSSVVTLSPEAQTYAKLNAEGVTITQVGLAAGNPVQNLEKAASNAVGLQNGAVSQTDFETLAAQFGASKAQADQVFQQLDSNNNGSVSNSELLKALGNTDGSGGTSASSQALLKLIDANGDGTVSGSEYLKFETAFVAAETSGG